MNTTPSPPWRPVRGCQKNDTVNDVNPVADWSKDEYVGCPPVRAEKQSTAPAVVLLDPFLYRVFIHNLTSPLPIGRAAAPASEAGPERSETSRPMRAGGSKNSPANKTTHHCRPKQTLA